MDDAVYTRRERPRGLALLAGHQDYPDVFRPVIECPAQTPSEARPKCAPSSSMDISCIISYYGIVITPAFAETLTCSTWQGIN